jgi:hypothetical protein
LRILARLGKAGKELDRILALIVLLVSAATTIWLAVVVKQPIYALGTFLVFAVCMAYLFLRKRFPTLNLTSPTQTKSGPKIYLLLNVIFFALLTYSILSFYLRPELYVRPLGYFISTALMATIVGIEIIFLPAEKSHSYFAVFKIIVIGLSLRLSTNMIFPDLFNSDPWDHRWITTEMLNTGHIVGGTLYAELPLLHLLVGSTSLITGTAYKLATMLSISSMQIICDALFVFLLARAIFADKPDLGNRVGLLAALFLAVANYHIEIGWWAIPNTLGGTFILPVTYLLLTRRRNPFPNTSLAILFLAALLLTHTVAMACLVILLFALWLASYIYRKIRHEGTSSRVILIISVSLVAAALGWWTYSGHITTLALVIKGIFLAPIGEEAPLWAYASFSEQLFDYLGILVFFAFSIMGLLYMISKFEGESSFSMAIGALAIFGITAFSILLGRGWTIIAARWLYFCQLLLPIPVAIAFLLLYKGIRTSLVRTITPVILISVLPFFMVISPPANVENFTFQPSRTGTPAFTASELRGIEFLLTDYAGKIGADYQCSYPIIDSLVEHQCQFVRIGEQLTGGNFSDCKDEAILIRDVITRRPFIDGFTIRNKLDYNPYSALATDGFSCIYNDGSVSVFVW